MKYNMEKVLAAFPQLKNVRLDGKNDYRAVAEIIREGGYQPANDLVWEVINNLKKGGGYHGVEMGQAKSLAFAQPVGSMFSNKLASQGKDVSQVEVVVLANSVKHRKHCVAGKCTSSGQWVRPVSNAQGGELSNDQVMYQNSYGTYSVKTLQKITMGFSAHVPLLHQPENFLINGNLWQQNYSIGFDDLPKYLDYPEDLWGDGGRVESLRVISGVFTVHQSLYLVQVDDLSLYKTDEGKRRAAFKYRENGYDLAVTDPKFDEVVGSQRKVYGILCVSLGEDYNGYYYKLVAAIF